MDKELYLEKAVREAEKNAGKIGLGLLAVAVLGIALSSSEERKNKREEKKLQKFIAKELGVNTKDIEMVQLKLPQKFIAKELGIKPKDIEMVQVEFPW